MMRIQKYLAQCGVGSRRACEKLIEQGRVSVNGERATIGMSVDPETAQVIADDRPVQPEATLVYLMMNKPEGYVSTVKDPGFRPTVMSLLPPNLPRVYPIGRLDRDSEGLLLFSNDGELTHSLLHPSRGVWKRYVAKIDEPLNARELAHLTTGVDLVDGMTSPCRAWASDDGLVLELKEGRKRQIRRMLGTLGHPVQRLQRIRFGPIVLGALRSGEVRKLTAAETRALQECVPAATPRP
jgi:23S rRNA pseudouridine2605 synthase